MVDFSGFSGIWVPLVTPFCKGQVDHPALHRLVQHLAAQGVAGFVACGSTGEAAMLDEAEQDAVLATTLAAAGAVPAGAVPVLMGLSGVHAERIAQRARRLAEAHAVAGWLLTAPAYVKPSQAGIVQHFHTVASATALPLVAYDVPSRTGVRIQSATLLALAEHPQIRALKDCSADRAAAELVLADGRLALLGGNDDELFDQLARGAVGGFVASAHLATARFVALYRAMAGNDLHTARRLWRQLQPITAAAFAEPNPAPVKAALARQGWLADELRAPMRAAGAATTQALMAAVARADAQADAQADTEADAQAEAG